LAGSPFLSPIERRADADESRRKFATLQSDHLALLCAYSQFDETRGDGKFAFARERFLGIKTLTAIASLKRQLLEALSAAGLAPSGLVRCALSIRRPLGGPLSLSAACWVALDPSTSPTSR
jgi:hypothetical protein